MTLSSNTAQTREIGELRNHLKWMDEERRKSGRKLTELEQRLAQQGRELTERDQKIQELEYHLAGLAERLERIPENDPNASTQEQRLQDLEWHLSNLSAQLARQPNPEEERARLNEELGRAILEMQQRVQSEQTLVEGRLLSEMASVREGEDRLLSEIAAVREDEDRLVRQFQVMQQELPAQLRLDERLAPVVGRQQQQDEALHRANEQSAALRESLDLLSAQLRERTGTLAAESQTNYASLANRVQEYLDALADQFETRTAMIEADWQQRLDAVANRVPDISPEFIHLNDQFGQLQRRSVERDERMATLAAESQSNYAALAEQLETRMTMIDADWQQRLDAVANRVPDVSPEFIHLNDQFEQLERRSVDLDERMVTLAAESQANMATMAVNLQRYSDTLTRELQAQSAALTDDFQARLEQLPGLAAAVEQLPELAAAVEQLPALAAQLGQVEEGHSRLEETIAKLGNARELMPLFDRMEQELELRQAEEVRLANLIGTQEGRFAPISAALEEARETNIKLLSRLSDAERTVEETRRSAQDFNDNWKPIVTEVSRRVGPMTERLTVLNNSVLKSEASLQSLNSDQGEMRETLTTLSDQVQRSRTENARQLEAWQATIDEHKDTIERFTQQWLTLSNQYKEARMAVQNFAHWQKQLEQQKREASEMLRIESNRMQSRWDGFLMEIQEKLKNFELDLGQKWQAFELENEQKWAGARRSDQVWREELGAVDELIQKLQQDNRNLIWRVQAAQADAIKKWPRLLMEEVEKAVELNPNRRLSPTGASPRGNMSVVDAIEQGLITIDYADDSAGER